jgi:carboxypeptidase Taq
LDGDLQVEDLPGAWNEKTQRFLGLVPRNDAEGCLQDIHWSAGLIGYFPTYTLGNLNAAQFFATASAELPTLEAEFVRGDYSGLLGWLRAKIHSHGQRFRAAELARRVNGAPLDHRPLIEALRAKYGELYAL